ncbi:MAG: hypothetical protein LHV68_00940 [Elusimicrobia bacterium]|nr:hypothetical protein [Candidatus Liberimonas magnetica]
MNKYCFVLMFLFVTSVASAESKWTPYTSIGYRFIPGKYYYVLVSGEKSGGSATSIEYSQHEKNANLELVAARFSLMKSCGSFQFGFEYGLDFSGKNTSNEWRLAKDVSDGAFEYLLSDGGPSRNSEKTIIKSIETMAIPLLVNCSFNIFEKKEYAFRTRLGAGVYIINQMEDNSINPDVLSITGYNWDWRTTDRENILVINTIYEFSPEFIYKISDSLDLGLKCDIAYIPKYKLFNFEVPAGKTEYEFGGIAYGGGVSLNLNF